MAGRERLAGVGIVAQMEVDRVASTVSAGDGIDGSIRLASHCPGRLDPHRRALRHRRRRIAPTDVDIVHPAIDAIRSEEHTSELQSLMRISYAVLCLHKNKK